MLVCTELELYPTITDIVTQIFAHTRNRIARLETTQARLIRAEKTLTLVHLVAQECHAPDRPAGPHS